LTMALNTEQPVGLDPALCQQGFARCYPVFGTLMVYDADSRTAHPGMAESLESDDGINWTLTLRPDVTFTDGTPFDAEAVVYNWDRIRDPETLAPGRALAETMEWEVVDDLTVAITLDEPNYELPIV